jgi:hypothetical protein
VTTGLRGEPYNKIDNAAPQFDVSNFGKCSCQGLSISGTEKVEKCAGASIAARAGRLPASGRTFEKVGSWDLEDFSDLVEPAGADPVHALFIFLNLLEGEVDVMKPGSAAT